jgi:hypothetical protein
MYFIVNTLAWTCVSHRQRKIVAARARATPGGFPVV